MEWGSISDLVVIHVALLEKYRNTVSLYKVLQDNRNDLKLQRNENP